MASEWKTVRDAVQLLNGLHVTGADATPQEIGDAVQAAADAIARLEAEHKRLEAEAETREQDMAAEHERLQEAREENQRLRADSERLAGVWRAVHLLAKTMVNSGAVVAQGWGKKILDTMGPEPKP